MFKIPMLGKMLGTPAPQTSGKDRAEPPPAPSGPSAPRKGMPEQLAQNLKTQGDAMIQYGARLLVMREMLCAMAVALPPDARASAQRQFRQRIDQLLSLTDDHVLPAEFHTALLAEVNYYLGELRQR
ncbi:conserved protein of unknown function (plasmid) [Cupriavidus taiwanensis]|uniref:Uncharacterized protein n=1 Tax=Cupriavidus taiwanensis TaxID=164546 RepID=A0A375HEL6_9BURK|nr:hypothetical protein [Cupriavidus taiwanensis]SOY72778.1 conserved hypothetical protein [Cupriavidus taiwanensis]SOY73017.1 conserved hypothetical protein [Cupriavidus taiwanensis]SOY97008.1 conserved hypothetical protein [Cupriavidus taiwanensis]SOZ66880.1 conserved hypothetical protein [Cupriavidus taiwanensis]SOZ84118.1 conserved hypothetical protein [Cupriavidus taiwanensis]